MSEAPELSVVVALISGRPEDLERCLAALAEQEAPPSMEVLVPYDRAVSEVLGLAERFPGVRFFEAAGLETAAARQGASREHHDTLRTLGLRAARGRVVALTEDHAIASKTWCADMLRLLDEHPEAAAVGGAVECKSERLLGWAVYYCDFGRYQNPLPEGPAEYVSDSNVAYRREALEAVADAWREDYHETLVHWALVEAGHVLLLTPKSQVWQHRSSLDWSSALAERRVWGRSFAGTRTKGMAAAKRLVFAAGAAVLPFLLTARVVRGGLARGRHRGKLLGALPSIFLLHLVWALGELQGYVTGDPGEVQG